VFYVDAGAGIILWEIITRQKARMRRPSEQFAANRNELLKSVPADCPQPLVKLMLDCVETDRSKRPPFKMILPNIQAIVANL
jgi:hypothetical protein